MLKLSLCVFLFVAELYSVQAAQVTTTSSRPGPGAKVTTPPATAKQTTTATRPGGAPQATTTMPPGATAAPGGGATPAPGGGGAGAGSGVCGACPTCPIGYSASMQASCTNCLCEWHGLPMASTARPSSLLIKILSNIGNNAGSISQMAESLKEELQLAQDLV